MSEEPLGRHPARWWTPAASGGAPDSVDCLLCPHRCRIPPGGRGLCRYRVNADGELLATSYGEVSAIGFDPIEKKPLYHFMPGSTILSLGTVGCNLACAFCQNWRISQSPAETRHLPPAEAAARAGARSPDGSRSAGIAYTYSEPLVWWEYVHDTARLVRERGLVNVLVTNGFVEAEPLAELLPWIDALNVDVKAFTDQFYRQICRGRLDPVLRTVETAHARGCHVEVTTLVVPGLNDSPDQLERLAEWLAGIDRGIPLHLSRYFPNHQMSEPGPTPAAALRAAAAIARRHLDHVYVGNAFELENLDTVCPGCGAVVIRRDGYRIDPAGLRGAACAGCGRRIVSCGPGSDMVN